MSKPSVLAAQVYLHFPAFPCVVGWPWNFCGDQLCEPNSKKLGVVKQQCQRHVDQLHGAIQVGKLGPSVG